MSTEPQAQESVEQPGQNKNEPKETASKFSAGIQPNPGKVEKKFQLDAIKATTGHGALATVEQMVYHVNRPGKHDFFFIHPDPSHRVAVFLIEDKENNDYYLVMPDIANQVPGDYVVKILVMYITRGGSVGLWPVKAPTEEGKLDSWNESATNIVNEHSEKWIRLRSNRSLGAYDCVIAKGEIPDPDWPEITYEEVVEKAFKGKIIDDIDHPMLKNLRGEL